MLMFSLEEHASRIVALDSRQVDIQVLPPKTKGWHEALVMQVLWDCLIGAAHPANAGRLVKTRLYLWAHTIPRCLGYPFLG